MNEQELKNIYDEVTDIYCGEPFFYDCSNGNEWGFNAVCIDDGTFAVRLNNPMVNGEWKLISESDIHNFAMKAFGEWQEYQEEMEGN